MNRAAISGISKWTIAVLLAVAPLSGSARPAVNSAKIAPSQSSATARMMERLVPLAPHVWAIHAPLSSSPAPLANELLIEQSDGFVLVDAGKTRGAGLRIVKLIRSLGSKPLKAVIVTHWHQDHVLGLGPIVETWSNVKVITQTRTLARILSDESYATTPRSGDDTSKRDNARAATLAEYRKQSTPNTTDKSLSPEERQGWADIVDVIDQRIADEKGTYLVLPTITFDDQYQIDDPVTPVTAQFLGKAHTDGDIAVWLPRQRILAAGDTVVAPIPFGGSHVLAWPEALTKIVNLHPRYVVPGHGPVLKGTGYVEAMIDALRAFRIQAERLVDLPEITDEEVMEKVDLTQQERRFAGGDRWRRYWFRQYFGQDVVSMYRELRSQKSGVAKP